ncbi:hypothetical protein GS429_04695 [Natronorubrum sp. JWXQ-INN-674]|uniref:Uncharacterized protein n=1 Tax=Natronorubrum halalkaliphilum TaxID=2691917 RepID=A0A6B0VKR5_9EURY|nr:hypothetical protein [Natronorubrum halalkaliphilum]MXV61372.1 hypothetical protein [Natronorubrum halalkaliphilum]
MTGSDLTTATEEALERCSLGRDADRLAEPPTLDDVYRVNTNRDGEPVFVPLVEIDLETTDEPELAAVYRIAAEVIRAVHPACRDEHVRQYDVVFAYGDTSWWDWDEEQRRIAVRPRDAERLTREPDFGPPELRDRLEELDDGDDEIPPVAWGETLGEWEYYTDDDDWSWLFFMGGAG